MKLVYETFEQLPEKAQAIINDAGDDIIDAVEGLQKLGFEVEVDFDEVLTISVDEDKIDALYANERIPMLEEWITE